MSSKSYDLIRNFDNKFFMIFYLFFCFFLIEVSTNDTCVSLYVGALIFDKIDQLSSICLRKTVNIPRLLNNQSLKIEQANF